MKIIYKVGNLLTNVTKGHIIHGANAQGVQGSGFAKALKEMYPGEFSDYRTIYEDEGLDLGVAYPYCPTTNLVIWNAITQEFCGSDGQRYVSYDAIDTCFQSINSTILGFDEVPKEIHIPKIGAGLGGGNWEIIREIIEQVITVPIICWIL